MNNGQSIVYKGVTIRKTGKHYTFDTGLGTEYYLSIKTAKKYSELPTFVYDRATKSMREVPREVS